MNKDKLARNIKLDYVTTFITNLNMQNSIWVLYLAYCKMSLMQIGLLEGIYHITSIICEIPSGALADLLGRKRSMILSRICVTLSCIIMLFARNFWLFAISFAVQALGNNFNSGSEEALVYDSMKCLSREEHYIKVNGRMNTLVEISQAIATVAGGVLAEYSYFWCYLACVMISVMAVVPVLFMYEPPVLQGMKKERTEWTGYIGSHFKTSLDMLKKDSRILKLIIFYSIIFAAHTLLFFYSQQYYFDFGYNKIQISLIMLVAGLFSCMGALISAKLYRKFGKGITAVSACMISATFIFYGLERPIVSIIMFTMACFFNSVLYPIQSEVLNCLIPSEQRATLLSVNSLFFSVMMVISFPVVGAFADMWNLSAVFINFGVLLILYFFVMMLTKLKREDTIK